MYFTVVAAHEWKMPVGAAAGVVAALCGSGRRGLGLHSLDGQWLPPVRSENRCGLCECRARGGEWSGRGAGGLGVVECDHKGG